MVIAVAEGAGQELVATGEKENGESSLGNGSPCFAMFRHVSPCFAIVFWPMIYHHHPQNNDLDLTAKAHGINIQVAWG